MAFNVVQPPFGVRVSVMMEEADHKALCSELQTNNKINLYVNRLIWGVHSRY